MLKRLLLAASLLPAGPATAQTLLDSVRQALDHHPRIAMVRADADAGAQAALAAADLMGPRVSLTAEAGRSSLQTPGLFPPSGSRWPNSLAASWSRPLYSGGALEAARTQAVHEAEARRLGIDDTRMQVAVEAISVHAAVVRDQALLALAEENRRTLQALVRDTGKRFQAGEATRTDVAQAEARAADGDARLARARADLGISLGRYRQVIGSEPGELQTRFPELPLPASLTEARALTRQHPALRAWRERVTALGADADRTAAGNRPQVSLEARAATQDNTEFGYDRLNAWGVYLKAHMTVFDAGHTRHRTAEARARAEAARWQEAELADRLDQAMVEAWANWEAARESLPAMAAEVAAAELARKSARQELAAGTRTTLDVLNAERDLLDARTRHLLHDQELSLSAYRVLAVIGDLSVLTRHSGD